jgi:hypothetical protein
LSFAHHFRPKLIPKNWLQESSTEVDSDDDTTSTDDEDSSSEESSSDGESDFSSGTNTECEFTDSEGKPNPFHKELEVPKIVIEPGSPVGPRQRNSRPETHRQYPAPRYVEQKVALESKEAAQPSLSSLTFASRLQYKTPNLSGRLQTEEVKQAGYVTRSTQRALSLKKNWVSDAPAAVTTGKKSDASELDNRLKNLMERLSSQQSLLKPAEKPSSQMEHMLKNLPSARIGLSQSSNSLRDPSRFKSPPPMMSAGSTQGQASSMSGYHFYPSPYLPTSTSTSAGLAGAVPAPPVEIAATVTRDQENTRTLPEIVAKAEEPEHGFTEVESLVVPERPEEPKSDLMTGSDSSASSSECTSSESSSESTQSEHLSPPPIPPPPASVPDILIQSDDEAQSGKPTANGVAEADEDASNLNRSNESDKEAYESCQENADRSDDSKFATADQTIDDDNVIDCNDSKQDLIVDSPLATSSPVIQTPQKEEIVVKVTSLSQRKGDQMSRPTHFPWKKAAKKIRATFVIFKKPLK